MLTIHFSQVRICHKFSKTKFKFCPQKPSWVQTQNFFIEQHTKTKELRKIDAVSFKSSRSAGPGPQLWFRHTKFFRICYNLMYLVLAILLP
jgi:hypothetical protein